MTAWRMANPPSWLGRKLRSSRRGFFFLQIDYELIITLGVALIHHHSRYFGKYNCIAVHSHHAFDASFHPESPSPLGFDEPLLWPSDQVQAEDYALFRSGQFDRAPVFAA